MDEKKFSIGLANLRFAKVVKICTWIGLIIMIFFGSLYLAGVGSDNEVSIIMQHWNKPVAEFWKEISGKEVINYSWFLSNLNRTDALSMLGIAFLSLTPLIGLLFIIPTMKGIYFLLLLVLVGEFLFSIFRPFF